MDIAVAERELGRESSQAEMRTAVIFRGGLQQNSKNWWFKKDNKILIVESLRPAEKPIWAREASHRARPRAVKDQCMYQKRWWGHWHRSEQILWLWRRGPVASEVRFSWAREFSWTYTSQRHPKCALTLNATESSQRVMGVLRKKINFFLVFCHFLCSTDMHYVQMCRL
jgi:hypothetical protein